MISIFTILNGTKDSLCEQRVVKLGKKVKKTKDFFSCVPNKREEYKSVKSLYFLGISQLFFDRQRKNGKLLWPS